MKEQIMADSKESSKSSNSSTSVLKWFAKFTSVGGLTHTRNSDNQISRSFWIIIFVIGCILTFISIQSTVSSYLEFDVNVGVKLEQSNGLSFPAVTICNANKVHCGNLHKLILECKVCTILNEMNVAQGI
jgi:hypothetical protein